MDDAEVLKIVLSGEKEKYGMLVDHYQNGLAGYFRLKLGNDTQAVEEAVQDTFVAAYEGIKRLKNPEKFGAYLFGVASNVAAQRWKQRRFIDLESVEQPHNGGRHDPSRSLDDTEQRELVFSALEELPESQRMAVVLHHVEGLSCREIALRTGAAVGTVRSWLSRAYRELRQRLSSVLETANE
jgi:RNA polymerase sigma-70 factor (ECF subfamily)